jgi:tRNA(Ile)-lysidine synthase
MGLMHKFIQHIESFFTAHPAERYFIACSGGVDSMALANGMLKAELPIELVHVNYGLRGQDSDDDQLFLETWCKSNNIQLHTKRVNLHEYLTENGGNLQHEARKVRYAFFEELQNTKGGKIVLAHHADDQAETFLLNLARGGGMMGLSGMIEANGEYLRPLLPFRKEEIVQKAVEFGWTWREDRSNSESKYSRNKLRNIILPKLVENHPDIVDQINFVMRVFQSSQELLEHTISTLINEFSETNTIPIDTYVSLSEFEKIELLRQLEIPLGYLDEVNKLANSEKGKVVHLSGKKKRKIIREANTLFIEEETNDDKLLGKLIIQELPSPPEEFNKSAIYLDPDRIVGTLHLRFWQIGDRMKPIGMKGSKLVSDILKDAKVLHHLRKKQCVVTDDERILWCVGFSVSREAMANEGQACIKVTVND